MNKIIATYADKVNKNSLCQELLEGRYDTILSLDFPTILEKYNRGRFEVLDQKDVLEFINSSVTAQDVIFLINKCRALVAYKEEALASIEALKSRFEYDPNARIVTDIRYMCATYQDLLNALEKAETILNSKKTYVLLKVLMKYECVRYELRERKSFLKALFQNDERRDKLVELIGHRDLDVGIIQIVDSEKGKSIVAGTKTDMAISDMLGVPFKADADKEGYEYGPHGDFYMPPYKCEKTFHTPETDTHRRMIKDELYKRSYLYSSTEDENGYIFKNGIALAISKRELSKNGIDPKAIGWKPLKVTAKTLSSLDLRDEYGNKLSIREQIRMKIKAL